MRRHLLAILAAALLCPAGFAQKTTKSQQTAAKSDRVYVSQRPAPEKRLFTSPAVEAKIKEVTGLLTNPKLAWMFSNCFPNTLDTTVHFDGDEDTFVYTGDIHAMWLRDSGAQVYPYVALCNKDPKLARLIRGVVLRQLKCINIDPFANAFNFGPTGSKWKTDGTAMKPELHERKWEIDSPCYVVRLAYAYWKATGDDSLFKTKEWQDAVKNILDTFHDQQLKEGRGSYSFLRVTDRQLDTRCNRGWGAPARPVGLIASAFRPSDDATTFSFLVPSNFFAVNILRKAAEDTRDWQRQLCRDKEGVFRKTIEDRGNAVINDDVDKEAFAKATAPVWAMYTKKFGDATIKAIQAIK